MKKILENIVNVGKKTLVTGALIASMAGCISVGKRSESYLEGRVENTASIEIGLDFANTTHKLSSDKTYFDSAPSTTETGNVGNKAYTSSIMLDIKDSVYFENPNIMLKGGLKIDYPFLETLPNDMTGYMAWPWDVNYIAGITPKTIIEPYFGIGTKVGDMDINFLFGFPRTNFLWEKFYIEQVGSDGKTVLEEDSAIAKGINLGLELEYFLESNMSIRFGWEKAFYHDVNIAGEETDLNHTRLNATCRCIF